MTTVEVLSGPYYMQGMTLSESKYSARTKTELIEEVSRLENQLKAEIDENVLLRKRLAIYKSIK